MVLGAGLEPARESGALSEFGRLSREIEGVIYIFAPVRALGLLTFC